MSANNNPQSDWSELSKTVLDTPFPMIWGKSSTVDAYCELELHERSVAQETLNAHSLEVTLWYVGLRLLRDPMYGIWDMPDDTSDGGLTRKVYGLQSEILGLEISSAKSGLDLLLAGHYSIALASVRHMLEAFIQIIWLAFYPEKADLWYSDEDDTPKCRTMIDQVKKQLRRHGGDDVDPTKLEALYQSWRLMCKGSHPTGNGITQVQSTEHDHRHIVGANYRRQLAYVVFDNGLFALSQLLECVKLLGRADDKWKHEFEAWQEHVGRWRMTLLDKGELNDLISDQKRKEIEDSESVTDTVFT